MNIAQSPDVTMRDRDYRDLEPETPRYQYRKGFHEGLHQAMLAHPHARGAFNTTRPLTPPPPLLKSRAASITGQSKAGVGKTLRRIGSETALRGKKLLLGKAPPLPQK